VVSVAGLFSEIQDGDSKFDYTYVLRYSGLLWLLRRLAHSDVKLLIVPILATFLLVRNADQNNKYVLTNRKSNGNFTLAERVQAHQVK